VCSSDLATIRSVDAPKSEAPNTQSQKKNIVAIQPTATNGTITLQARLKELNYYRGPIDGLYGPRTGDAVRRVLSDYHILSDANPSAAIAQLSERGKIIREVNSNSAGKVLALTMESFRTSGSDLYVLHAGDGPPVYKGNSLNDLMTSVETRLKQDTQSVFIDLEHLRPDERDAFAMSLRIKKFAAHPDVSLHPVNLDTAGPLMLKRVELTYGPIKSQRGHYPEIHYSEITARTPTGLSITARIWARTKEFLTELMSRIAVLMSPAHGMAVLPAAVLAVRELRKKYSLSDDAMGLELSDLTIAKDQRHFDPPLIAEHDAKQYKGI